jgi:hypothetical protein
VAEWVNPLTGHVDKSDRATHPGGLACMRSPEYAGNIALRLEAKA